jgi:cyclic beta-1,2-glucan synthetase
VPQGTGGYGANPLSLLNRWKILDNLRRSLLPATSLGLVVSTWFISPRIGLIASLVVGMQLLFHPLAQPFTMATTRKGLAFFSRSKLLHDLLRAITDAALMPHQAVVALDAIAKVCYRRMISQRDLLEWAAQATHLSSSRKQTAFVASLALGSLFSSITGCALWYLMPGSLLQALP